VVGAKHAWGCEPLGQQKPQKNLLFDIAGTLNFCSFGLRQETTTWVGVAAV